MEFIANCAGRLDKILQNELELPRNQVENFIKNFGVKIESKTVKKCGYKLTGGEKIAYELQEPAKSEAKEVDFDVDIIYEDDDILIINKPSFLTVHPAPSVKEATLVDWLKYKGISLSNISGEERHGIVHRIDKQTSGALAIAKNNEAHLSLSKQLEDKSMGRYYLALVDMPLKENAVVQKPIARNQKNRLKMGIVEGGKDAKSAFCKLELSKNGKYELICAKLYTGRTHQIRVHLSSMSRHILGDDLYGFKSKKGKINRVMLHAYLLYLDHPKTGERLLFRVPLPKDFNDILEKDFNTERVYEKIDSANIIKRFDFSD